MTQTTPRAAAQVLGISIEALNFDLALDRIATELEAQRKGYVCMAGVHGIMEAHRDPRLAAIYASSTITVPDGAPIAWVGWWQGYKWMRRVAGPELMLEVFRSKRFANYSHFFYGGEEGVAQLLKERLSAQFPHARILGTFTPPFRDLNEVEEQALIAQVSALQPDIIWVGISTPKQERFIQRYLDRLDTTLMFGVGAAFDYHTDRIQDAPKWIKLIGMQWLHRLAQDPRRLWKRYLRNNPTFLMHLALQLTGLREYPQARHSISFLNERSEDASAQKCITSLSAIE